MRNFCRSLIVAAVFALLLVSAAQAQDFPFGVDNVPNVFGIGVGVLPDYQGSNDYIIGAAPFLKYTPEKTEYYALLLATELYINVLNHPTLRLGPVVNYRFGRDDDVEDDVVQKMEEIEGTIEAGAFIGYEWKDSQNPLHRWGVTLEFLGDVGSEYKGYLFSLSARYWVPVHKMAEFGLAVGTTYCDDNYMETYFGVDERDSDRTGLPIFDAEAGMKEVRVIPAVVVHFSPNWHVGAGVRYARFLDDAEDSPVVDDQGSADQWVAGVAVAYTW